MSEVKKISPVGNIYGWEESQFGEFVLSQTTTTSPKRPRRSGRKSRP